MRNLTRKMFFGTTNLALLLAMVIFSFSQVSAQAITEGFEAITTLPASGWATQNNSVPVGTTGWFQGGTTFPAQAGPATSWIGANFNNTTGTNTISNWLIAPTRTLNNGDVFRFHTRTITANPFPDRLQVRLSTAGASANVGTGPTGLGDFTRLLLDINPMYGTGTANYPETFTQYTITISGLAAPTSGRLAFRYFVEEGGPAGDNSNLIGIDSFTYTPNTVVVPTRTQVADVNGDGRTDYVVTRPDGGGTPARVNWYALVNGTASTTAGLQWGQSTDQFLSADFDGDRRHDFTVWRPAAAGTAAFFILNSMTNTVRIDTFGQTGDDVTVIGDYDGDGRAEPAAYRRGTAASPQSFFYYRGSMSNPSGNVTFLPWGAFNANWTDYSYPGDFDGDGRMDVAVGRDQTVASGVADHYIVRQSSNGAGVYTAHGDIGQWSYPGDYNGDGRTDYCNDNAFVTGATNRIFNIRFSGSDAPVSIQYGLIANTRPVQGDYDGDGRTDIAIWESTTGNFYVRQSSNSATTVVKWGQTGDFAVAGFNRH